MSAFLTHRVLCKFSSLLTDFTLLSTSHSKDLKTSLLQYSHNKTNARIYHFLNSDPQNAYASIIKTYVQNDTGCPHILEHLATCGSKKYPIRDPFFNMLKRSVNTYMNAWTGDDFTSYPFSSANPTDWRNLYGVYLDMSLSALLNQLDFRQEGWRYEIGEDGKRELKGIVLNEMKGAYQDSDRQMIKEINQTLFKGTPYVYDSGGRPRDIVNLQYQQLKKMYQYYYHPSNMSFYFYGNSNIEDSMNFLAKQYLNKYQDQSHLYKNIKLNPQPSEEKYKTIISQNAETNNISINYFFGLNDQITPLQSMFLRVLAYILLEKSNAKVYQKFIQTGIAQNIGFAGYNQSKLTTFSVTLKGIYHDYTCETFQQDFKAILTELIEKGIQAERVKEFVHQFQVNLLTPRENNGIRVLEECMNRMNHRLDFETYLNPRPYLQEAARKLLEPEYLQKILKKFFLENDRKVVVRQLLAEKEIQQEPILSNIVMDDSIIKSQQQQLSSRQNQKQNSDVLPILKMQDIIKPNRLQPVLVALQRAHDKTYSQYHIKINEDINFYRLVFNFQQVDAEFLKSISLWMYALNRTISTKSYSYNQLTSQLANHTSGFNVFHSVGGKDDFNVVFQFSCLKKNVRKAFSLLEEIILSPKFQKENTLNAYRAFTNEHTEGLVENPMNECLSQAAGRLTRTAALLNSYQRTKESFAIIKDQNIQQLYHNSLWLNKCNSMKLIEHSNQKSIATPTIVQALLKQQGQKMKGFDFTSMSAQKGVIYNYMVNFCAQTYVAPKYLSKEHAHVNLFLEILQQDYLHPLIREKGGAYGTGARVRNNGIISLSSYLDPNPTATFQIFDDSIDKVLAKDTISDENLLQAKIKQFGEVDRVKIPQNQGVTQILKDYTQQEYEQFREALKTATFKELVQTGRNYFKNTPKSRCLFGRSCPDGFQEQKLKDFLL